MRYIVELEEGVWLASITGDPGRTIAKEYACRYATEKTAKHALEEARRYRPFKDAKIKAVEK